MKNRARLVHVGIPREFWRALKVEAARTDRRLHEVLAERLGFGAKETAAGRDRSDGAKAQGKR